MTLSMSKLSMWSMAGTSIFLSMLISISKLSMWSRADISILLSRFHSRSKFKSCLANISMIVESLIILVLSKSILSFIARINGLGPSFGTCFGLGLFLDLDLDFCPNSASALALASALLRRYIVLRCSICDLILPSDFFSSSEGGLSSGNEIVDLLYSSLSFRLMCVNFGIIYSSGGDIDLVLFGFFLLLVMVWLVILDLGPVPVLDSGSDLGSESDLGSDSSDSGSGLGSGLLNPDLGLWTGLGSGSGFWFGLLGSG